MKPSINEKTCILRAEVDAAEPEGKASEHEGHEPTGGRVRRELEAMCLCW